MSRIKINQVYNDELFNSKHTKEADIIILYGGSSSGKSYYTLGQHIPLSFAKGEKRNWLILRKVNRTVKKSVYNEFKKGIISLGIDSDFRENKSEQIFTHKSGYQVIFSGLDDREKIKSITPAKGVITNIVMEEATDFDRQDLKQLEKRLRGKSEYKKQIWLLFNPIHRTHWIYEDFFKDHWEDKRYKDNSYHIQKITAQGRNIIIIRVTHYDNKQLEEDDRRKLETEVDEYMFKVYTLGEFGVIGETIFKNWVKDDLSDLEESWEYFYYGLDFGFNPDPNALLKVGINERKKEIYIFQEWGGINLDNEEIAEAIKPIVNTNPVICDSAEPKSLKELKKYRIHAIEAKKPQGSIKTGIKYLQKFKIIVDYKCRNTIRELSTYKNETDKNGNVLPQPEDKNNHWIDALRYALNKKIMSNTGFYKGG